uniref:Uncharacterized protein n=1 Tax=uncultured Flavobacteriia bacterium TaxID=212695 RepID=H6RH28_9BACT|nr:hypothetical protein [uncultured bacterium]CCG00339.1 hypothetical protein VIS_S18CTB50008 [uncultured Flavobacteriia bacterium]|tara:strand:+ start:644 stop:799 length:156 start_codon:yes stop_codon:yes gene_type:complete
MHPAINASPCKRDSYYYKNLKEFSNVLFNKEFNTREAGNTIMDKRAKIVRE